MADRHATRHQQMRTLPVALGVALAAMAAVAVTGCDSSSTPVAPSAQSASTVTTAEVLAAMNEAIVDEYRAETIYEAVVGDFGPTLPFSNIISAEERHSTAVASLFIARGLAVPENAWTMSTVPHFTSITAACAAGVVAEQENIQMYDELLQMTLPPDVARVFGNNRAASLVNHLPAFQVCDGALSAGR